MHIAPNDLTQLQQVIEGAKEILVVTHQNPTTDSLAASLALYLTLPQIGKRVSVACPDKVTVEVSNLVGIDKVTDTIGSKNFVISLDYAEGSIEKVSYNIEGDKFNLVVEPRPGFSFSQEKVGFSRSGGNADIIIVIGAPSIDELKQLGLQIGEMANRVTLVNIDTHANNTRYGRINMVFPGLGSVSEAMTQILKGLNLTIPADAATNLLAGVMSATANFTSPKTSPDSFEAAALLMRMGAQKTPSTQASMPAFMNGPQGDTGGYYGSPQSMTGMAPFPTPQPAKPRPQNFGQTLPPLPSQPAGLPNDQQAPPDWLKPKIFKSGIKTPRTSADFSPNDGRGSTS